MKTVIIGSGNIATHIGKAFLHNGFEVVQVISRNKNHAKVLAEKLKCKAETDFAKIEKADIYLIAVNDSEIESVVKKLNKYIEAETSTTSQKPLVLHTAASVSINILASEKWNSGILYPLQSLKKEADADLKNVPFIISGKSKLIKEIAKSISNNVIEMNDEQRLALHVSAVFVNNFTNHLIAIAQEICEAEKIDFKLLQLLLKETFERLEKMPAVESQTGPALRGDENTIQNHLRFFTNADFKKIYRELTLSIQKNARFNIKQ